MSKEKNIHICSYDVVFNATHKVSSVFKYFQQIAGDDLDAIGLTYEVMKERSMVFVLAKMKAVFYRPLYKNEDVVLKSCHRHTRGATFIRDYILICNEEVVGEASSYWALINPDTRRLIRPSMIESELTQPESLVSFEIEDRFSFPENADTAEYLYNVVFSDIDENCHMNNTRYPDVCLDALGDIPEDYYVSEVRIDYLKEAKKGDVLKIRYTTEAVDGAFYFCSENQTTSEKCFDAFIKFSKA